MLRRIDIARAEIVRLAQPAMATRFELVLAGDDPVRLRAIGEEALAEVAACEAAISPFVAGSSIARVNQQAGHREVRVDPLTFELLKACAALHTETDGAFDPTVGARMRALGFRDTPAAARVGRVGMDGVVLDRDTRTVRFARPGLELDLGAIGKGHALDLAAEVLREHGVDCALMHAGTSTVLALGAPPDADGWRVTFGPDESAPVAVLRDAALSVSAHHGRESPDGDSHVLDPRTGDPSSRDVVIAAVSGPSARAADAWSTALLILGAAANLPPGLASAFLESSTAHGWRIREAADLRACRFELPTSPSTPALTP